MGTLTPGMVAGSIRLPDRTGNVVSTWRFKGRQPLVLVLWDGAGSALLDGFAARYSDYRAAGAEVLAIAAASPPEGEYPFPLLQDAEGATARLAERRPAVLVLDEQGELFHRTQGPEAARPDHRDLLEWVRFTFLQCEECGPHAENWPRRDPGF
ncbi:MAG: peroxiredoxin family protein [Thiohalorhabdus sp.]|uniref:peroxiredoxin family protein n=1 Tax=Thiohalorhabdus sp. TaxID=3094134 RepID=UPI00397EFCFD